MWLAPATAGPTLWPLLVGSAAISTLPLNRFAEPSWGARGFRYSCVRCLAALLFSVFRGEAESGFEAKPKGKISPFLLSRKFRIFSEKQEQGLFSFHFAEALLPVSSENFD